MQATDHCPVCHTKTFRRIAEHTFTFPGEDIEAWVRDFDFPRLTLWVLFEKILQTREAAVFHLEQCADCGFIFSNPRFSEAELALKYASYNALGVDKQREAVRPSTGQAGRAERVHALLAPHLPARERPRVLDYGGASGDLLRPFTDHCRCELVDYADTTLAPGVEKIARSLDELDPAERFDAILLLHTLEHVPDPRAMLCDLADRLADDGMLHVEVPLGCFGEWKFMNEPLMHLNFFSEQSLWRCFDEAGLQIVAIETGYHWVTHCKIWCVSILGRKGQEPHRARPPLPTAKQMKRWRYYLPYLANPSVVKKVLRKLVGK